MRSPVKSRCGSARWSWSASRHDRGGRGLRPRRQLDAYHTVSRRLQARWQPARARQMGSADQHEARAVIEQLAELRQPGAIALVDHHLPVFGGAAAGRRLQKQVPQHVEFAAVECPDDVAQPGRPVGR
mmetsp:Transcript_15254/g.42088  ORF Transcript_15254/g.42088 Transcript_15254/m.42088 type:complete len:128 (-) Transcript_15254:143-526(-)